ncbi:MAG: thioredoxin family protein [Chloroflexota bacterium]
MVDPGKNTLTEQTSNCAVHLVPGKVLLEVRNTPSGPGGTMLHDVETVARELGILVAKIDSTQYPELVKDLKVQQLPTLILYDENGREQKRRSGHVSRDGLANWLGCR